MQISASMVKDLRERSGAGMMECKKALVASGGDIEAAYVHLRKSGAAQAAKKAGRIAAEGAIVIRVGDGCGAIVEVNSETDFVAKDENFADFADAVASCVLSERPRDSAALDALETAAGETVEQARQQLVAKIGENIGIRRFELMDAEEGRIGAYLHGKRIGVLVELAGGSPELAKDIAMHITASNPLCVAEADVPPELLEREREIQRAQADNSGKPPEIVEKMIAGRLRKFIGEITLQGQPFVKDPDKSVGKLLEEAGATVKGFIRYEVGEGIEKKQDNFAQEVMDQAHSADKGAA
jgi:elongation factor Ts